jgi:hypothetical protein
VSGHRSLEPEPRHSPPPRKYPKSTPPPPPPHSPPQSTQASSRINSLHRIGAHDLPAWSHACVSRGVSNVPAVRLFGLKIRNDRASSQKGANSLPYDVFTHACVASAGIPPRGLKPQAQAPFYEVSLKYIRGNTAGSPPVRGRIAKPLSGNIICMSARVFSLVEMQKV